MTKQVVILGAGWAGLPLAHKLLKYTAPKMDLKITLVTPNSHFYWNVAATRGIIKGEFTDSQLFHPIAPGFEKYPACSFELVLGKAEAIEKIKNTVVVRLNTLEERELVYDELVIATGSQMSTGLPLKPMGSHEETLAKLHALQDTVAKAKAILISGAGSTGVEVAGEIAARYGRTLKVYLVNSGKTVLESQKGLLLSVQNTVASDLSRLGVEVINECRVTDVAETSDGRQNILLSSGKRLIVDCYLPLHGIKLNTAFVPPEFLDVEGNVSQEATMRVRGSCNIWAIGDIGSIDPKQLTVTDNQIIHLAATLDAVLTGGGQPADYQSDTKTMAFYALGKKYATGQIGNWKLFGIMVSGVKGRNLFTKSAQKYVNGRALRHAPM